MCLLLPSSTYFLDFVPEENMIVGDYYFVSFEEKRDDV